MKISLVTWHDTIADTGWKDVDEAKGLIKNGDHVVCSVGTIISRDGGFMYLAGDWGNDGEYNRILIIPLGMVKNIESL